MSPTIGEILDQQTADRDMERMTRADRSACVHGCVTWRSGGTLCCSKHPILCEHGNVGRICPLTHVLGTPKDSA